MWFLLSLNPKVVSSIYGKEEPSLLNAQITDVKLDYSGPSIAVDFLAENFPITPPLKWVEKGYNAVKVHLRLIDIGSFKMEGWHAENLVNMEIRKIDNDFLFFHAVGIGQPDLSISITFKWLYISIGGFLSKTE